MPGGLIQLVAYGAQNVFLNGNPTVSFFKKVYKTHTNFSTESIKVIFNKTYIDFNDTTLFIAKIDRNADLIQEIYFSFEIPEIKKKLREDFRFVKNLGEVMIDYYKIYIGGTLVDTQYGEWLHIWNELTIESSKKYGYDKLIGNIPEIYSPDPHNFRQNEEVQVEKRRLYVPLKFWFNKNPGLALPLIALQYHEIEIHIQIKPYKHLFTVKINSSANVAVAQETYSDYFTSSKLEIQPYLEVNYVFLDTTERNFFSVNSQDYLIEQVVHLKFDGLKEFETSQLVLQNPVKEIIWVFTRDDQKKNNKWFEYTDSKYEVSNSCVDANNCASCVNRVVDKEIMKTATFSFNGVDRMEEKVASYFNLIQPFQHHTVIPPSGVYVYSFSLMPEQFQPSGSCNMSRINSIELKTSIIQPSDNTYKYNMHVYVVNYNFLRIAGGLGGLAYSC
jgi:hypothetical protein